MTLSACLLSSLLPLFSRAFLLVIRKTSLSTWVFQLRFWSTHVPRNSAVTSIGIWNEFSSILMFGFVPFGLNNSPTVFSMFKVNLFELNHSCRDFRSSSKQYLKVSRVFAADIQGCIISKLNTLRVIQV